MILERTMLEVKNIIKYAQILLIILNSYLSRVLAVEFLRVVSLIKAAGFEFQATDKLQLDNLLPNSLCRLEAKQASNMLIKRSCALCITVTLCAGSQSPNLHSLT